MHEIRKFDLGEVAAVPVDTFVYKTAAALELDMTAAFPDGVPKGCVLFVHGGGWKSDTSARFLRHAEFCALNGAVGVTVNYRRIGDGDTTDLRDGLLDCADALAFTRNMLVERYGNKKIKITVAGDSAGGYYAACLGCAAIRNRVRKDVKSPDCVADFNGIVKLGGRWAYALPQKDDEKEGKSIEKIFSPIYNIHKDDAPVLIWHGDLDKTVPLSESTHYHHALLERGVDSEICVLTGASHAFILFDYKHDNGFVAQTLETFLKTLRSKGLI